MKTLSLILGSVLFFNLHLAESKADEPIVSGEVKSGTLLPGSTERYYFDAVVGSGIMAAMGDVDRVSGFYPQVSVYGPDGGLLGTQSNYNRASVRVTAVASGTHYVVASATAGSVSGRFNLSIARCPGTQATDPEVGGLQSGGNVTGMLEAGELEVVSVDALAGSGIMAAMGDVDRVSGFYPQVSVYGPDGTLLGTQSDYNRASVRVTALVSGTHYVVASASGDSLGGRFNLSYARCPGAQATDPEVGGLQSGGNVTGMLEAGELEVASVDAVAGSGIMAAMGDVDRVSGFYPQVSVYGPDGALLGTQSDYNRASVRVTALVSGTHYVVASASGDSLGGRFNLSYARCPGTQAADSEVADLQSGGNVTGMLEAGELEVASVDAVAGAGIMAAMGDVDRVSGFYPQISVYGPDGALLGTQSDYNRASVRVTAVASGTHYVVASASGDSLGGRFNLSFARCPGTQADDAEVGSLQSGGNVTGMLEAGELEVVSVDAVGGTGIMAAMGDVDRVSGFYPQISVYGPDGALLGTQSGYDRAGVRVTALASGTHYIVASASGDSLGGRFNLSAARCPGTQATDPEVGALHNGGNVTGLLEAGELEVVSVEAVAGVGIMAAMADVDRVSGFYPQVTIYGPDGALLATDWDYDRATATGTATKNGTHYVVGSANGDGVGGRFSLFLGVLERLAGSGQFAGTVRKRADNAPVTDAIVQVWSGGKLRAMGWTGSNGSYQISGLAAGVYELRAVCPGLFAQALPGLVVLEHQTATVNFLLDSQAAGIPAIAALTPSPVLAVNQRQWLTLFGSGFQADTVVVLRTGGETYQIPRDRTAFVSSTQIKALANLTSQPASWTAQVVNSGGSVSALFAFQVQAPPNFQLGFPLAGNKTPYTAEIVSVFDHNMITPYQPDNSVMAFSGEVGTVQDPNEWPPAGATQNLYSFKKTAAETTRTGSAAFLLGGANYTGTRTTHETTVNYDGHPGYDYRVPIPATPVFAAADGVVGYPPSFPGIGDATKFHTLAIDHGDGYKTYYLHLSTYPPSNAVVADGTPVKRGQLIGYSGWAGLNSSTAEHLHFEVQFSGAPVDPYGWEGVPGTDPYTPQCQNLWDAALQLDETLTGFAVNQQQTGVQVSFKGEVGRTYVFQASEDLTSWTPLQTVVNAVGRILFCDTDPKQCRFYKVISP